MNIIGNIFILFFAFAIGGIGSFLFVMARSINGFKKYPLMMLITVAIISVAFFASTYSQIWLYGIIGGFLGGLFAMSLCIACGEEEAYMIAHKDEMTARNN